MSVNQDFSLRLALTISRFIVECRLLTANRYIRAAMTNNEFIDYFVTAHLDVKAGKPHQQPMPDYEKTENRWLALHGLGKFETFRYLYSECRSVDDFHQWLQDTRGADAVAKAARLFDGVTTAETELLAQPILSPEQWQHWQEQGYLRIGGLVPIEHCERVKQFICDYQGIDLNNATTWYPNHSDWHGLMLQVYQQPDMETIRRHPAVKQLFAELYETPNIAANTDKVSYNPPETEHWQFRHHALHWDIDHSRPPEYYIQGLIYLDDTPEERGPLRLIPGFHQKYEAYQQQFADPVAAQHAIEREAGAIPVPGRQGDIVVWLQTLPHAASINRSDQPRFVQYLSFTKLD
ncbi:phytanoyl-CoA dioxygenase family protein [Niabella yanshanensis]|uniref:Phytanoyl-CoA dioxygenase family protein n=1 Tax=Niabella yanshanensis TaxID=577386 RepID=A0ABZ0W961_9BACT|nr:phytanoyl-CoA dioxygenase family protein [Niabella yanshanensis]WQD39074.1 phytanoyl-CoA dioxygenase family protein [Niabella yanshanensis]